MFSSGNLRTNLNLNINHWHFVNCYKNSTGFRNYFDELCKSLNKEKQKNVKQIKES